MTNYTSYYPYERESILYNDQSVLPRSSAEYSSQEYQNALEKMQADAEVGMIGGLTHGAMGSIIRARVNSVDPLGESTQYIPTDEEREQILQEFGFDIDAYKAVVNLTRNKEDLQSSIDIVKENLNYSQMVAKAGIFDQLGSGFGDAATDPVNLVVTGATGGFGWVGRAVGGAVANVASGQFREKYTGVETSMMVDAASGLAFGLAFEGLAPKSLKWLGDQWRESQVVQSNFISRQKLAAKFFENSYMDKRLKVASGVMRDFFKGNFLRFRIDADFKDLNQMGDLQDLVNKTYKVEAGRKDITDDGATIYRQYASSDRTAEEILTEVNGDIHKLQQDTADVYKRIYASGLDDKTINRVIFGLMDGKTPEQVLSNIPDNVRLRDSDLRFLAKLYRDMAENDRMTLVSAGRFEFGAIDTANFFPRAWDRAKVDDALQTILSTKKMKLKDAKKSLRKEIADNLVEALRYNARALKNMHEAYKFQLEDAAAKATKESGEDVIADIPGIDSPEFKAWVQKQAKKTAMGIVDQGDNLGTVFDPRNPLSVLPDGHRLPWDTSYVNSKGFSVNDLRMNHKDTYIKYHRRVGGERIASEIYGVKGYKGMRKLWDKAIKEEINGNPKINKEAITRSSDIIIKKLFGMGLRDYDVDLGFGTAMSEVLRNLTFASANTFMGLLNYTEMSAGILAYGPMLLVKSIPGMDRLLTRFSKGGMTKEDERMVLDLVFAREPNIVNLWGDIRRTNRYRYGNHKILADIVSGSQYFANALPTTKFLQASQINIVNTARGAMLGQMIRGKKGGFLKKGTLERLNIDPEDYDHLKAVLKKSFTIGDKGEISIRDIDALLNDTDALAVLRRLGDYAADETILRPHLADTFNWDTTASPLLNLLMQFKSFALRSYSKRLVKMAHRVEEGEAVYQAANFSIAIALAGLGNLGITAIRTSGMSDEEKDRYYETALGIDRNADIEDNILPLFYSSIMRSSPMASASLVLNALGVGTFAKTTSDLNDVDWDRGEIMGHLSWDDIINQMVPSARYAQNYANIGIDLANLFRMSINPDDYTYEQEQSNLNKLWKSWRAVTPQYGYITNTVLDFAKDEFTTLE